MRLAKALIPLALGLILGVPFAAKRLAGGSSGSERSGPRGVDGSGGRALVVVTPHIEQIRTEMEGAFRRWHQKKYGEGVEIDWRTPGGTSEILKQLRAEYESAARSCVESGRSSIEAASELKAADRDGKIVAEIEFPAGTLSYDIMLGGGSFEHTALKTGSLIRVAQAGGDGAGEPLLVRVRISTPAGFAQEQLDSWYGENSVGSERLYDPDQYWLGKALSGFGIVYNKELVGAASRENPGGLGMGVPRRFLDLTDVRYAGRLALADPRLSGSVATTYDSILNNQGWDRGWRTLREMGANARYFSSVSIMPPIDVSQGEAAAGVAIDFYGRGQSSAVLAPGQSASESRVGYVDPQGETYIDADPVSILGGGPNPELAKRFVEFCLSMECQSLWQMHAASGAEGARNPVGEDGEKLGPRVYELRRMPVRRVMYEGWSGGGYREYFIDEIDPFGAASATKPRGWRDAIGPMMGAFAIDSGDEVRAAWKALNAARNDPEFPNAVKEEMEHLFYAFPAHTLADGTTVEFSAESFKAISDDTAKWNHPVRGRLARIGYTGFFQANYRRIIRLYRQNSG